MERKIIQVEERPPLALNIPLSIQHLFAMFGSTVLVPFLFNVSPTTCLFMNGIGTLLYLFITKGRIPSYLGSSFAFISPVLAIMATSSYHDAQSGFIVFGIIFILFSALIKATGTGWIDVIFPPACMGAIIAVIGLELAPTAASMAGLTGENNCFYVYPLRYHYRFRRFPRIPCHYTGTVRRYLRLHSGAVHGPC